MGFLTRPILAVVSGPPGAGKTTLAHAVADALGWPAVCRDEILFQTLRSALDAGQSAVAEAAFQDRR